MILILEGQVSTNNSSVSGFFMLIWHLIALCACGFGLCVCTSVRGSVCIVCMYQQYLYGPSLHRHRVCVKCHGFAPRCIYGSHVRYITSHQNFSIGSAWGEITEHFFYYSRCTCV